MVLAYVIEGRPWWGGESTRYLFSNGITRKKCSICGDELVRVVAPNFDVVEVESRRGLGGVI